MGWALEKKSNVIIISVIAAAFFVGTLTSDPVAEAAAGWKEAIFTLQSLIAGLQGQIDQLRIDLGNIEEGVPVVPIQVPRDNSLTLIAPPLSVRFGTDTSITIAEDGLPVISSISPANLDLKIVKCGNISCSSGNIISTPDNGASIGGFTSITFGIDGLPLVSYYDRVTEELKVLKCGNAACSSGNTITPFDSTGLRPGQKTSITIGTDGLPVISYFDTTNLNLKVAKCGDASCTAAGGFTITPVDTDGQNGSHSSITIGTDGLPIISYASFNTELRVAKCGNVACTAAGGFTITVVDPSAAVIGGTTITLGEDGLPIISYSHFGFTSNELKVLKCGNAACSSGNIITILDSGPINTAVGNWSSISIPPDGLPVISYFSGSISKSLNVVKCGNTACSTGNTITTVDTGNFIGRHTSITIGIDGLPIISYGGESENLKVAKCGNSLCLPFWTRR